MYQAQEQSKAATVLVVGMGALGCAAARTLADAPGVRLLVVDDDRVERSNLQRQVLYDDDDIGRLKVDAAAARLHRDFDARVDARSVRFDADSGPDLVASADVVIDATDDAATKFLLGRLCVEAGIPYVHGGVARTGGQWMAVRPGESACLECVFPATTFGDTGGCSDLGILAPVAGTIGALQGVAALGLLYSAQSVRAGRLHLHELTGRRLSHLDIEPDDGCFCRKAHESAAAAAANHRRTAS